MHDLMKRLEGVVVSSEEYACVILQKAVGQHSLVLVH
jgi:hypothetical protein